MGDDGAQKKRKASSILRLHFLSPSALAVVTLALVALLHSTALWVFSRGFLLHRVALSDRTGCTDCSLPPRYDRLVLLIVDALRDDFLLPYGHEATASPFYHNILTTPAQFSSSSPSHARSFRFVADPPTTTLQRLKGLTVGTLPTFIDAGSNFVGSEAEEDTWLEQARKAGKRIAFMGDDTWTTVFPPPTDVFHPNLTFPYDSFNVEDLDTVDRGVVEHLYPLLDEKEGEGSWEILIGHFLGLDHVGHRVGPNHPEMTRKLREAEEVVRRTIAKLRKRDLLVVMGDHGMDDHGDHGGDSPLEVNAGLFLYAPSGDLAKGAVKGEEEFDRTGKKYRSVSQISLVPTLSLLLGLPIPFSNLGTIIPDLFPPAQLERAVRLNAEQVATFLRTYLARDPGADLSAVAPSLLRLFDGATSTEARRAFIDNTLKQSRAVWATFDMAGMIAGLVLLAGGTACSVKLFVLAGRDGTLWRSGALRGAMGWSVTGGSVGAIVGVGVQVALRASSAARVIAGVAALGAEMGLLAGPIALERWPRYDFCASLLPLLHIAIFGSNSLVIWEDRVVLVLLIASILLLPLRALFASDIRLRDRVVGYSSMAAVLMRLASVARLCREEQQGAGTTTFYGHDRAWLLVSFLCSLWLPRAILYFLNIARADGGLAKPLIQYGLRLSLLASTAYWALEGRDAPPLIKNTVAWMSFSTSLAIVGIAWRTNPLAIRVEKLESNQRAIIGFANTFGATYLVFASFFFALVYAVTMPAGHAALSLGFVALLCLLEANDSLRDILSSTGPSFHEIAILPLWAHAIYFATGHQATLPSLQWKVAFVGFSSVTYPFAPLLIALNTLGPLSLLPALVVPLYAFWNTSPPVPGAASTSLPVLRRTLRAILGVQIIFAALATVAAAFAAHFRRHLMVWKVFAPRFMLAAVALMTVDVVSVVVVWLPGVAVVLDRVKRTFGTEWA